MPEWHPLPNRLRRVTAQLRVVRHDHQLLHLSLSDQHPIERIAMVSGQAPGSKHMRQRDRKRFHSVMGYACLDILTNRVSAKTLGHFSRQPWTSLVPPEEDMCEQEPHFGAMPEPYHSASSDSDRESKSAAVQILPLSIPGTLLADCAGPSGTKRATGLPAFAMSSTPGPPAGSAACECACR